MIFERRSEMPKDRFEKWEDEVKQDQDEKNR